MRYAIWDLETSGSDTFFCHILEAGGVLLDENFKEIERFNLRGRLPEGELFQAMALIVNGTSVKQLTQVNLSHYQLITELEKIFKRWGNSGNTTFLGWSNIGFDDEMLRKEFFRGLRDPYLLSRAPNKRNDGLNIARAAYGIDKSVLNVEFNHKNNPIFKLESLSKMQGFDTSTSHTGLTDALNTAGILNIIKKKQPENWNNFFKTSSKADVENLMQGEDLLTLSEFFYGRVHNFLIIPLHKRHFIHPVYKWALACDVKSNLESLVNMNVNELKNQLKVVPKFLRTVRSNKSPILLNPKFAMREKPYNIMTSDEINKKIKLVRENEKFSQNILTAVREIAEDKEQSSSQEDIFEETSIYNKFTSNKDTLLFQNWHEADWPDKLRLISKFEDKRLHWFAQKLIYQEAPDVLPTDIYNSVKRKIAKRITSNLNEKWLTIPQLFSEIDTLRGKFEDENDQRKLSLLNEFNNFAENLQSKYENA